MQMDRERSTLMVVGPDVRKKSSGFVCYLFPSVRPYPSARRVSSHFRDISFQIPKIALKRRFAFSSCFDSICTMGMIRLHSVGSLLVVCLSIANLATTLGQEEIFEKGDFSISGYLPDYRFYIDVNQTAPFLTDLQLFSVTPKPQFGARMLKQCCLEPHHYEKARQAVAYGKKISKGKESLNLWVTVGGAGRSSGFAAISKDPEKQKQFLAALLELATKEDLDGVDFDCEEFLSQQDVDNYLSLIAKAVGTLHDAGIKVSVAIHADQNLPLKLYRKVDRINLMAYDLPGPYHALHATVEKSVDSLIQSGCPAHKISLGIPTYARHTQNPGNVKTFAEIVDAMEEESNLSDRFDVQNDWNGFKYDSPQAVRDKVDYAKRKGLAGVFFWELGQDKQHASAAGGLLLEAAARYAYSPRFAAKYNEL
jgi:chitinase